jgi:hypothetical protein
MQRTTGPNRHTAKKWEQSSWQGVYVGHSSLHAGNVALIYNPQTCHVTQQFHVTYDESYSSVLSTASTNNVIIEQLLDKTNWLQDTATTPSAEEQYLFPEADYSPESTDVSQAFTLTTSSTDTDPTYKPVKESPSFIKWKEQENIHAEVFHCSAPDPPTSTKLPTVHTSTSGATHSIHYSTFEHPPYSPTDSSAYEGALNVSAPHIFQAAINHNDTLTNSAMLRQPTRLNSSRCKSLRSKDSTLLAFSPTITLTHSHRRQNFSMPFGVIDKKGRQPELYTSTSHAYVLTALNNNMA